MCIPMARSSILPLSKHNLINSEVIKQIAALDAEIKEKLGMTGHTNKINRYLELLPLSFLIISSSQQRRRM
jgi:hypothetical protein